MERGFGFEWKAGEPPRLILPDGSVRILLLDQHVPVLAFSALPKEGAIEQGDNADVAETSDVPLLPFPEGEDLIVGNPARSMIKKEHHIDDATIAPKAQAGGDLRTPRRTTTDTQDEKTRHYLTHFPKDLNCPVCMHSKAYEDPAPSETSWN